ncbi:hypothetical protein Tco_1465592 [Tanacetum coccineum]
MPTLARVTIGWVDTVCDELSVGIRVWLSTVWACDCVWVEVGIGVELWDGGVLGYGGLNEEEVFDDEEMTQVKVLMDLADDELDVGNNHACNGEWIDITLKKTGLRHSPDSKFSNVNTGRILASESQAVHECLKLFEASTDPESSKEFGSKPQTSLPPLKNL